MKRLFQLAIAASLALAANSCASLNTEYLLAGGLQALQAATLSDAQVQAYVHEYITQLDAQSKVLPESSAYTKRLRRLTTGLTEVGGVPLNFKVYNTKEVNAFACADGSVRVYTGLMDLMNDNEIIGVIGHEIGHVALKHTRKEMQTAMLTSAAMTGISAAGETVASLTQSQLGAIGEAILNAQYSKKQESAADDYAYKFLVEAKKNPVCLMQGLQKLQSLEQSSGQTSGLVSKLFSSHPDTEARIQRVQSRLVADGFMK